MLSLLILAAKPYQSKPSRGPNLWGSWKYMLVQKWDARTWLVLSPLPFPAGTLKLIFRNSGLMETHFESERTLQYHITDEWQPKPKKVTSGNSPMDRWVRPGQTLEGSETAISWPWCSQSDYMSHLRPIRCQRKSANSHFSDGREKVRGELLVFPFPLYSC